MSRHTWRKQEDTKDGKTVIKNWTCKRCGCEKHQANHKFSEPDYIRSGQIYSHTPLCVEMGRRSNEPLD